MKFIVTGSAGFIGSCLVSKLNSLGTDDILAVDVMASIEGCRNLEGKKFKSYLDKNELLRNLESNKIKADIILHMGACADTTETDESFLTENNYLYTQKLAVWAMSNNARFLYASSAATYGAGEMGYSDENASTLKLDPLNLYGRSKQQFDLWVLKNKLDSKLTGFKFFNVFGPNEYHKGDMKSLICKAYPVVSSGKPMRLFKSYKEGYSHGEQKRDFVYIKDVLEMVCFFIDHPDKTGIFNIGTGNARAWNDVASALFAAAGREPKIEYIEMPEILKDKYQYFTQADMSKLKKAGCKHECMSLEEAVKDYSSYLAERKYL